MALLDLIASGNTDIPSFVESYQSGLKNMREARASEQTATLRDLQISQAQKEASTYEEDRARRIKGEELGLQVKKQELTAGEQQMDLRKQQMDQIAQAMEAQELAIKEKRAQFDRLQTTQEREDSAYNLGEVERHITAATSKGVDFIAYIKDHADEIKVVGDKGIDKIIDDLISGKHTPQQLEQIKALLVAGGPARQKLVRELQAKADPNVTRTNTILLDAPPITAAKGTEAYGEQLKAFHAWAINTNDSGVIEIANKAIAAGGELESDLASAESSYQTAAMNEWMMNKDVSGPSPAALEWAGAHVRNNDPNTKGWAMLKPNMTDNEVIQEAYKFAHIFDEVVKEYWAANKTKIPFEQAEAEASRRLANRPATLQGGGGGTGRRVINMMGQ